MKRLKGYIITALFFITYVYITLPPLNAKSLEFWFTIILTSFVFMMTTSSSSSMSDENKKPIVVVFSILGLSLILPALYGATGLNIFTSGQKADVIEIETKDFYKDFTLTAPEKIPLLDRDTAQNLGNRKLGELGELVSQYVPSDEYVQINVKGEPFRVTPLEYAGFFKWFSNKNKGIGHYLSVNMYNGGTDLVKLEENMKYSFSERFGRDLVRHLRFNYPTRIFGEPSFELDDKGKPYYIATSYEKLFGFGGKNPNGLLIVDPVSGEITEHNLDEIPDWVDRVQSADIVMEQINWNLKFQNGFFNSLFSKKGVRQLTKGYNYIPIDEDIYLYSGVTSANSDASNLGFILVNMRTKDVEYYPLSSAEEFSAMDSAEGSVQEKEYKATFPLLLNLDGEPMYVMSLKDNSGLVKAYSLVDVQDYQKVYTANSIKNLLTNYYENNNGEYVEVETEEELNEMKELIEIKGNVTQLKEVVKNGNTTYFFIIDNNIYEVNVNLNKELPYIEENDKVDFEADENGIIKRIEIN